MIYIELLAATLHQYYLSHITKSYILPKQSLYVILNMEIFDVYILYQVPSESIVSF